MNIKNPPGLSFHFLDNGSIRSIEASRTRINLKPGSPFSVPGSNIFIRKRSAPVEFTPLSGPSGKSRFTVTEDAYIAKGRWCDLDYTCVLQLSDKSCSWQWKVEIINRSGQPVELDLICLQDIGLGQITDGPINEYYVSQYLERLILEDKYHGSVICCRQNMKGSTGNPWLMMACKNGAISGSTDGMQFYGKTFRETSIPEGLLSDILGGEYAGESSVVALQEKPFVLNPGQRHMSMFAATYLPDHPEATSEDDLARLTDLFNEFAQKNISVNDDRLSAPVGNMFSMSGSLPVDDLNEEELVSLFGNERRHSEVSNGKLLSFFCRQNDHVSLRVKETLVDRPQGHIMQAKAGSVPDESIVSTTSFASGVFNSHITQGNTNFNTLLSVCTTQFNTSPGSGQRMFVGVGGRFYLLGIPSAFEIGLNHCRWIYKHGSHLFQVRTWTSKKFPRVNADFRVLSGEKVKLVVTNQFDHLNGWTVAPGDMTGEFIAMPGAGSMIREKYPGARFRIMVDCYNSDYATGSDDLLYQDRKNRGDSMFVIEMQETAGFCISFIGEVCSAGPSAWIENADEQFLKDCTDAQSAWRELSLDLCLNGDHKDIAAIREILPWYGMNALTHFLTPFGLEQFSGAAWGTRDVAQGPVDLLLSMEKHDDARKVLQIIFSNQDPDGGWAQWWMFDRYSNIRAGDSHGDIVYWCIIALGNYIRVTGDLTILDEVLPYYHEKGAAYAEKTTLGGHVDRLVDMIVNSFIPGTALVPFGGGDWNDSLQPVSKELARRMISTWTVEMNYQAFNQYRLVYEQTGTHGKAAELKDVCERIRADFNKFLVRDGIVAGYGLLEDDGSISLMLHPSDNRTGVRYSILPMERGIISEIFTDEQARLHLDLVEERLKGPDGARLMDRPLKYKGGIQELFQRAESSTFFGREIGLMYVHEHIRYAEALARTGRADAFLKALRQAIPVAYRDVVPCGDIRQSNCYYSSSDAIFRNRYEADELYDEIKAGKMTMHGGWRVYSSGPGIYIGLVVTRLLGLRIETGNVVIDPVIPGSLDGLSASVNFLGRPVTLTYSVKEHDSGPGAIVINGNAVRFTRENNKYRRGGALIPAEQFSRLMDRKDNSVRIEM